MEKSKFKKVCYTLSKDLFSYLLSFVVAFCLRFGFNQWLDCTLIYQKMLVMQLLIVLLASLIFHADFTYKELVFRDSVSELYYTLIIAITSGCSLLAWFFFRKTSEYYSRLFILYLGVGFMVINYVFTVVLKKILRKNFYKFRKKTKVVPIFVYSTAKDCEDFISFINSSSAENYVVKGVLTESPDFLLPNKSVKVFSNIKSSLDFICREWLDGVFVSLPLNEAFANDFVSKCLEMGIPVHCEYNNGPAREITAEEVNGKSFISFLSVQQNRSILFVKRLFDIFFGFFGSVFTIVLTLILGPIIKLSSPGPIFFVQKRVGKNGRYFNFIKFRSMVVDAESQKSTLLDQNKSKDGLMFKMDFDPRIIGNRILPDGTHKTGIGEFIRKTSLDEFPQFFNVLMGDMSLVGTRPPTVDEWKKYIYHHRARLTMKPGITGMWQVSGRSQVMDFEKVVQLDMDYINHFSLSLDFRLVFKTISTVLRGKGAM